MITEPIQHYSARELKGEGIRLHLPRAADYERITSNSSPIPVMEELPTIREKAALGS
jgi:hypothetical protein